MLRLRILVILLVLPGARLTPQELPFAITAGMGVNYSSMRDVVSLANATAGGTERLPEFNSGVEFILHGAAPLGDGWAVGLDYAYQVTSFNVPTLYTTAEYTVVRHAPTLLLKRVLMAEPLYYITAGAGIGYHAGRLRREHLYLDNTYSSSGVGLLALVEGNTSLGGSTYASLGVTARWELAGPLLDSEDRGPGPAGGETTLREFGVGARLGLTFGF